MYIDTHCHISKEYYDDIDKMILENKKANIEKMIISGCEEKDILESINLSKEYKELYLTLGYHPSEADSVNTKDLSNLEKILKTTDKIVGVGEIGLDYHYGKDNEKIQKQLFESQLEIAEKLNLPVVIHSRDATEDTISILKKHNLKGVIHCFSGSLETAKIYIGMGYKLGIGGVLTFKNSKLSKVIENISLEDIVLETDAPYLAPVPFRGEKNSSKYIPYIAEKIAEIKKVSLEEVSQTIYNTTITLFDFDK